MMFELFGPIVRLTTGDLKSVRFLPPVAALCAFLCENTVLFSADERRANFLLVAVAQLVNALNSPSFRRTSYKSSTTSIATKGEWAVKTGETRER